MTSRLRRWWHRLWYGDDDGRSADPRSVGEATLRHHLRHELSRGWDGPVWRTPREVRRMRREESRVLRMSDRRRA